MGRPKRSRPLSVRRKHSSFAPFPRDADTDTLLRAQETAVPFSARQSIPYVQEGTLMKRSITALALGCLGISCAAVVDTAPASANANPAARQSATTKCPPGWYKNHLDRCVRESSGGIVTASIPDAGVTLKGLGSASTQGTLISAGRVTMDRPHGTGHTFKIFASGRMPALTRVQKGTLYSYAPKANGWSKIARIIQPGIYEAVYGRPTSVKSNASRDTVGPKPAV